MKRPLAIHWWIPLLLAFAALLALGAARSCDSRDPTYGLTTDTTFTQGCFPPTRCPVLLSTEIGGTFRLVPLPVSDSDLSLYRVDRVYWLVRIGEEDVPITGSGFYQIGGGSAPQQRLELDLRVGDQPVEHFDSGLVGVAGDGFPDIDVRISIHGESYFDTVIEIHAIQFPLPGRTRCGPELTCDATKEVCVLETPVGPATVYSCAPVPAGCESDRSCDCAGSTLCEAPFSSCTEPASNTLQCECLECQ